MREPEKSALIYGQVFSFETMVEHASGEGTIVLCRNEFDELRYVTSEEWRAASVPSVDGDSSGTSDSYGDAPVTQSSTLDEKVDLVMSLFRGRTDVYAEGYEGKATNPGKLSYWPPCRLRWVRGACPRLSDRKARCRDCDHPSYVPLTHEAVEAHCKGNRDKSGRIRAIGIYVVDGDI